MDSLNFSVSQQDFIVKKHNTFAIAKVLLSSRQFYKPGAILVAQKILEKTTFGKSSKKHAIKATHALYDITKIWAKHFFEDDLISHSRNIARKSVFEKELDSKAAKDLLKECAELQKKKLLKNVKLHLDEEPKVTVHNGICSGISMDIAYQMLVKKKDLLNEILPKNESGASKRAVANQAIYDLFSYRESYDTQILNTLESLNRLSKQSLDKTFLCDFDRVGQAMVQSDPELRFSSNPIAKKYSNGNDSFKENELPFILNSIISKEMIKPQSSIIGKDSDRFVLKDPLALKQAAIAEITDNFNKSTQGMSEQDKKPFKQEQKQILLELDWTISFLQFRQGIKMPEPKKLPKDPIQRAQLPYQTITNPIHRHSIANLNIERQSKYVEAAIARARGLKFASMHDIMGHHSLHASDASYLQNVPLLNEGVYQVVFRVGKNRHAITYIKKSDEEGYILDPNGFHIACKDSQHTIRQFQKLLALYREPNDKSPLQKKGDSNHMLDFEKYEVITNSSL